MKSFLLSNITAAGPFSRRITCQSDFDVGLLTDYLKSIRLKTKNKSARGRANRISFLISILFNY
jgi:hypothetical protein